MVSSNETVMYQDGDLQAKHEALFCNSTLCPLEPILPPNVSKSDFEHALVAFANVVRRENVVTGPSLVNYVDPYQMWYEEERNVPSAAVW
jgi:hypothetical protein